ncbi:MAG: hypothetical protein AAFY73_02840 [Pseudomonadota bacterium]
MRSALRLPVAALALSLSAGAWSTAAYADSCWDHNGSIMRLKASGNFRTFVYERPRAVLQRAGVRAGTVLFEGVKSGNSYSGTARRFSRFCPGDPLIYDVAGPVRGDQLQVTVFGTYEVHERCVGTGRFKDDRLVFTYAYDC